MKRPLVLVAALVAIVALAVPALAASPVNVPSKFSSVLPKVKTKSRVAVRLPSSLDGYVKPSRIYGAVEELRNGRYHLSLGGGRNCHEATACFIAAFLGERGGSISGSKVTLSGGIKGRYSRGGCGASCAPDQVQWKQGGVAYSIQYKGTKRQIVALAKSAIAAGPR
jgi:hypothetical protein